MAARPTTQPVPPPAGAVAPARPAVPRAWLAPPEAPRAPQAAHHAGAPVDSRATRLAGAGEVRHARATTRRLRLARVPVLHTLAQGRGDWPPRLPRLPGHTHCPREWSTAQAPRSLRGGGGLGPPPRATALGATAGLQGASGRLPRAMAGRNTLAAAQHAGRLQAARQPDPTPALRSLDARGDLPLEQAGAALRCPVISLR